MGLLSTPNKYNDVTKHDWVEDFDDDDNGDYQRDCDECGVTFRGHKHRVGSCKSCWVKYATRIVIDHNTGRLT